MKRMCIFAVGLLLILQMFLLSCVGMDIDISPFLPDLLPPEVFTSMDEFYEKYPDVESLLMEEYSHSFVKPQNFKFPEF